MQMSTYCAVLLDTISIQKYVFASNVLKDNLGASHIIKNLFEDSAVSAFEQACDFPPDKVKEIMRKWEDNPEKILLETNPSIPFEIGVSGGGKALIFFRNPDQARSFIRIFTRELLIKAPGIQLAVAIDEEFPLGKDFAARLESLFGLLMQNRNRYFPLTTLPNHGITAICPQNGTSLNTRDDKAYISIDKDVKQTAAKKEEEMLCEKLGEKHPSYSFSNRVDWLGQKEGDSYTAIIHIDGNGMGQWFENSIDLKNYRQRSYEMARVTEESFWELVDVAAGIMKYLTPENGFDIKISENKSMLPLRPLILGGDDFTFICEGRLGLYLAEQFITIWTKKANQSLMRYGKPENGEFSACAGVAIAKTKYPFYRTYQYAEKLCDIAKQSARKAQKGSWIDFHIISGTKSGDLETIRKDEGIAGGIELHFGPYCIEDKQDKSINNLKEGITSFRKDKYWAHSNVKELRTVFYSGKEVLDTFLIDMTAKGGNLPYQGVNRYENDYSRKGYVNNKTPYFDMLEMMEFYPPFLRVGGSKIAGIGN